MTKNPSIVIAKEHHVESIKSCASKAYEMYIERMQKTPAPMVADFKQQVEQGIVAIALVHDEVVGYAVSYPVNSVLHLENIAVLPSHQRLGLGRKLVTHVEQQAIKQGLWEIQLYTNVVMHENISLYKHLGYVELERKTQDGFERVFFSKALSADLSAAMTATMSANRPSDNET